MKNFVIFIFVIFLLVQSVSAQCDAEPQLNTQSKILAAKTFTLAAASEVSLAIEAAAEKTSWLKKDSEAAALTVFVDGKYHQDLLLFGGAAKSKSFVYQVFIGEISKGAHRIEIIHNKQRSAPNAGLAIVKNLAIKEISPFPNEKSEPKIAPEDSVALSNAPFIYARPNAVDKFSDVPLIVYYEILSEANGAKKIRYSVIFSHEDGGTNSQALMARWGRMTDIEWIYEIALNGKNEKIAEIFQGANHVTTAFSGKKIFGSHPAFYVVTDNNNFADSGCSALRFAPDPVKTDLSFGSRETLMEKFPWTYRVMSEEILRENRVDSKNMSGNVVGDPREYLYVEVFQETENSAISLEVKTGDGRKFVSDWDKELLRVGRAGFVRIALFVPAEIKRETIKSIAANCFAVKKSDPAICKNVKIEKIVRLDENFVPIEIKLNGAAQTIKAGEQGNFELQLK